MESLPSQIRFAVQVYPQFAEAFLVTISVAALALPLAAILGLVVAVLRSIGPRWLTAVFVTYIEVMRNTPLLLQMFLIYYGLPMMGWRLDGLYCGVLAIALQHAAFLAETFRGAIASISRHQWEAGRAIGLTDRRVLREIILPQALIKVAAPIGNQLIVLVKDTSLVAGIGVLDLTLTGKIIIERTTASFEVFIIIATLYLALTTGLGAAVRTIERRTRMLMG